MQKQGSSVFVTACAVLAAAFVFATASQAQASFAKGPYLQSLSATGVTVMFDTGSTSSAQVDYGTTSSLGKTVSVSSTTKPAAVRLTGLLPNTTYSYKVTQGSSVSSVYTFKTLPNTGLFTFGIYGDDRSNPSEHAKILGYIKARNPAFVLNGGDIVYDGTNSSYWTSQFFVPAQSLISRYNMFTVPGNHEKESSYYFSYLGGHDGKKWYSFNVANAHFVMLDSNTDLSTTSSQYKWLVADLAASTARWKFVALHHPLYSSGEHGSSLTLRHNLMPIFEKYQVDMVFTGHDHDYERSRPIIGPSGQHPVMHVVSGGGGAPLRALSGGFFTAAKLASYNYCTVQVAGETMLFKAYDGSNNNIDTVYIIKSGLGYANGYPFTTVGDQAKLTTGTEEPKTAVAGL
jgi:acid phosphatase type 7